MPGEILGLHHVTAMAGDPQANLDFYVGVLGQRLVKRTVNQDDPGTYHLYYGVDVGTPGSLMTFFPWPGAQRGRRGTGLVTSSSYSILPSSVGYWTERLKRLGIGFDSPITRRGETILAFADPDDLRLELVASPAGDPRPGFAWGDVPAEHAIRGFHSVAMSVGGYERTAKLLAEHMGFRPLWDEAERFRYAIGSGGPGALVDVRCQPDAPRGQVSVGQVHHVAWRVADDAAHAAWHEKLVGLGYDITPVVERFYFKSVYFREPGGVLFEIATDPPGMTVDERADALGEKLVLPPWLESMRPRIERVLPPLGPADHARLA